MLKILLCGFLMAIFLASSATTQTEQAAPARAVHAAAVEIQKVDLAGMKVLTRDADGKDKVFRFTSKTPVGSLADAGISKSLAGGEGYQFIVRYTKDAPDDVATAFDFIGKETFKSFKGTLLKTDPAARTVLVKTSLGIEGTFYATDRALVETRSGAVSFNEWARTKVPQETRVAVRYTVQRNRKVMHLLQYWEPELE